MFFIFSILKRHLGRTFVTAAAVAALSLIAQPAHAAGETYTWADDTNQTITVSGGAGVTGSLKKTADAATDTFAGDVAFSCNPAAKTAKLTVVITPGDFKNVYPTSVSSITAAPAAACVKFDPNSVSVEKADGTTSANAPGAKDEKKCDNGSVSWIMCPFIDNATKAITTLATGVLQPLLKVKAVNPQTTPELYAMWKNMVALAETMFLLVFLVIIFATMTQQDIGFFDQYTIKKVLPRLVIAAILVQASFLIVGFMIDIGNVLGAGVGTLLQAALPSQNQAEIGNAFKNLVGGATGAVLGITAAMGVASWMAVGPLLASLALSLLVVFLVLGLRYLLIAILIVVAPLAMVAWVLPNTRKWAGNWMELMLRLIMMYPIIIGIITIAGLVSSILPDGADVADSAGASLAAHIIKPIVVLATFLIIPLTFKLAGRGLNRAYDVMNGQARKSRGVIKASAFGQSGVEERKRRKNKQLENFLGSKSITKLSGGNALQRGMGKVATAGFGGGLLIGGPMNKQDLDKSNSNMIKADSKALEDLTEAQSPVNLHKALAAQAEPDKEKRKKLLDEQYRTTPNLAQIASNPTGRLAIINRLSDKGYLTDEDTNNFLKTDKRSNPFSVSNDVRSEYPAMIAQVGKSRSTNPFATMRTTDATNEFKVKDGFGQESMQIDKHGNKFLDRQGNAIPVTISRERGDVDKNSLNLQLRKTSAGELDSKMSTDNWNIILKAQKPTATVLEKRVAVESAQAVAESLSQRAITGAFDVTGRNLASTEVRLKMARAFESQRDTFKQTKVGEAKFEAITADFHRDSDITHELAREAGVPANLMNALSVGTKGKIAYDWMEGKKFDFADYNNKQLELNTVGNNWAKDREKERRKNGVIIITP